MPEYTFEIVVRLRRDYDRLVITKRVPSIYMTVHVDTAYAISEDYLKDGWVIEEIKTINFDFALDPTQLEYPD